MRSHKLNIYRLVESAPSLEQLLPTETEPPFELENENLTASFKYKLFIQRNAVHPPAWFNLLEPVINSEKEPILSTGASFILFVQNHGRHYALTGGHGHVRVSKDLIDSNFGIQMAKIMIDPDQITSLTQKAMKGSTRQLHRAVIGYRPNLDLENHNRLLRAIEGKTLEPALGVRVVGKTSLSITQKISFNDLESIFEKIWEVSQREPAVHLPESFEEVLNRSEIDSLNQELLNELNSFLADQSERDRLYLEFKDLFTQFQCHRFSLVVNGRGHDLAFFSLENVRQILSGQGIRSFENLNDIAKVKINAWDEQGVLIIEREPLTEMLIFELDHSRSFYLLSEKHWYRILDGFKNFVDEEVGKIPVKTSFLPDWPNGDEAAYNSLVATQNEWINLDRQLVAAEGATTIEVCDLYNPADRQFIHVKKVWGSKTSYLFAQGAISAELNYQSQDFRNKCHEKWPSLFDGTYSRGTEIVFGIADAKTSDSNFPNNLSYFAKLNLVQTATRLQSLGYVVSLAPIRLIEELASSPAQ